MKEPDPTTAPPLAFEVQGLAFDYGTDFSLTIDELRVARGEKLAIVGENGSGKTTLLRLLALLARPRACTVLRCLGRDNLARDAQRPAGLGLLRQRPYLFSGGVAHNLAYPLRLRGVDRATIAARVEAMLETIGLRPYALTHVHNLSGGEQKRLALGRVLMAEPELLLLDEPSAHLDPHSRGVVARLLEGISATVVLTTHDLHFAHQVCESIAHLRAGRIAPGLPENILSGDARGDTLRTPAGLTLHLGRILPPGRMRAAVDPRVIVVSREALDSSMRNQFPGRISAAQEHNGNIWLEIDCGERLLAIISRASYERMGLNLNQTVVVSFKANAVEILQRAGDPAGNAD